MDALFFFRHGFAANLGGDRVFAQMQPDIRILHSRERFRSETPSFTLQNVSENHVAISPMHSDAEKQTYRQILDLDQIPQLVDVRHLKYFIPVALLLRLVVPSKYPNLVARLDIPELDPVPWVRDAFALLEWSERCATGGLEGDVWLGVEHVGEGMGP